jgi:ADP-ribose pyrophosphatase YjhB (NUDIX family)
LTDREAFGRLRRYCEACDRIVFHEHKVAAALMVTDDHGRLLLVRRAVPPQEGLWSLPAGFVDFGESPAEAAVRECVEETGLIAHVETLLDLVAGREHPRGADIVVIYSGHIVEGHLQAADDASEAAFFSVQDLPPLAFEATRRAVDIWRHSTDL